MSIRRRRAVAGALMTLALAATSIPASASGADLRPLSLSVDGGEGRWHADPRFALRWRNPPAGEDPPVAAVHYRLLDPSRTEVLAEARMGWPATAIQSLSVETVPGIYTAEVWLEDASGSEGPAVTAELRYDESPPGDAEALPVSGWIGRTSFPYKLRLSQPGGPTPLSGIRGWSISIDQGPWSEPCADPRLCAEAETDLYGGVTPGTLSIGELPEGLNYVRTVAVSGSGRRSSNVRSTLLRVDKTDPVTRLYGDPGGWSSRPVSVTARASDGGSGMVAGGDPFAPFTALRIDGGAPILVLGDEVTVTLVESGLHTVAHYARDAAGNVGDGGGANGQPNRPPATALVRIDRDPPSLAFRASQDPGDPEAIEAHTADSLSGVDAARGWIAVRATSRGERFERLPTEVAGGLLRARWDSEAYPPGVYEFRVTAFDRAGNEVSTTARASGTPMRLRSPLKLATNLAAELDPGDERRLVTFGDGARLRGRLVMGRRAPLAGAEVRVIESFDPGAEQGERVTTVRTGEDGGFDLRLEPGPSRQIVALAPPTPTRRAASSRPLRLAVRGSASLRVSSRYAEVGGRPIVFSGHVASADARVPPSGKLVELQFRLGGRPWSEFRTIRTDRRGRFHYPYRFADDDSRGARFQFRAYSPAQAGWPFEPAGSAPVTVLGR